MSENNVPSKQQPKKKKKKKKKVAVKETSGSTDMYEKFKVIKKTYSSYRKLNIPRTSKAVGEPLIKT